MAQYVPMQDTDLFDGLSDRSVTLLETAQRVRELEAGTVIFLEGEQGSTLYRLRQGSVRLFRTTPEGREVTIHMVRAHELFAEIVLFESDTYPVSAVTVVPSTVTAISRSRLLNLLDDSDFRNEFMKNIVQKMRFLSHQLYVLATMDVKQRLLRFIEMRHGRAQTVTTTLSKRETAEAISVRPETLSRALRSMKDEGVLIWEGHSIRIAAEAWES